jgi:hypothetical protein
MVSQQDGKGMKKARLIALKRKYLITSYSDANKYADIQISRLILRCGISLCFLILASGGIT